MQALPRTTDIKRVERYELLLRLLTNIRRRRRLVCEYQALLARLVRSLSTADVAELEVSVYDALHDQRAKRFKETMVSYQSYVLSLIHISEPTRPY